MVDQALLLFLDLSINSISTCHVLRLSCQALSCITFSLYTESDAHQKVFIYVYLQFKSGYKDNYLALTSLNLSSGQVIWLIHTSQLS